MKVLIFVSVSSLKTLVPLKVLQGPNLKNYLLCLATKEYFFIFKSLLYKQIEGVAIGSTLGASLADALLSYHEKNLVKHLSART